MPERSCSLKPKDVAESVENNVYHTSTRKVPLGPTAGVWPCKVYVCCQSAAQRGQFAGPLGRL